MQAPSNNTPYNSIYSVLPSQNGQEKEVVCCAHGRPCEEGKKKKEKEEKKKKEDDSANYVNLDILKKGGTDTPKSQKKMDVNASLGERLKDLKEGKRQEEEEEEKSEDTEKELRRIRKGLKTMEIGEKPKHQKKSGRKEKKGGEEFDVKSDKREEEKSSRYRKSRRLAHEQKKKSESKKSKPRRSKEAKRVESFESIASICRAAKNKPKKNKPKEGAAEKAYLGIIGWQQAEDLAAITGEVTIYHRLEEGVELDSLEDELPLFLLRLMPDGKYRHFRILRGKKESRPSWWTADPPFLIEDGSSPPTNYSSLDEMIRHLKKSDSE